MRVMAKITIPVESGSRAVKDGSIGGLIQGAAERWKPEAMTSVPSAGTGPPSWCSTCKLG
jgi:hypothetical protein